MTLLRSEVIEAMANEIATKAFTLELRGDEEMANGVLCAVDALRQFDTKPFGVEPSNDVRYYRNVANEGRGSAMTKALHDATDTIESLSAQLALAQRRIAELEAKYEPKFLAESGHVCGLQGFNPMLGDVCHACRDMWKEWEGKPR